MDTKKIITNTIIVLITTLFFIATKLFLGPANIIVSILVFLIGVFILNKDFTGTPLRIAFKIIGLSIFIGVMPYLANLNIYTGLFINFISIFILVYLLIYSLKKTIYFPFLMGYCLLLGIPAKGKDFAFRILALTIIGIMAVIVQLVINKRRAKKNTFNNLNVILNYFLTFVDCIIKEEDTSKVIKNLDMLNSKWSSEVFETRNSNFYLSKKEGVILSLISSFDALKRKLISIEHSKPSECQTLKDLKDSLSEMIKYSKGEVDKKNIESIITKFSKRHNETDLDDFTKYELYECIDIIAKLLIEFVESDKASNKLDNRQIITETVTLTNILKNNFNKSSVRFTFALRTSLTISITYFIVQYFKIPHGTWIIYTIASVSQPYNDTLKNRSIARVVGTTLGAIYFLILFYIFHNANIRLLILLLAIYAASFSKSYKNQIKFITILVLGLAVMSDPNHPTILSFDRIYFIIIGVIITLLAGKFIYPYYIAKETEVLINQYYNVTREMIDKLFTITEDKDNTTFIQNSILLGKSIETKIKINNTALDDEVLSEFINLERYILVKIKNIINRVEYGDISLKENREERIQRLNELRCNICTLPDYDKITSVEDIPLCIRENFNQINKVSERLIYTDICEILINIEKCSALKDKLLAK